jgi:hypothetical protein
MELITTTVSVDAQKAADQVIIHLVKGDSGTRRFQFVPIEGGHLIDMSAVAMAKVQAYSQATSGSLLIDCVIESGNVYMTPTPAFVASVDEWSCQLVLLDGTNQTLSSMPFTTIIHGRVYEGDAVEHTNNSVLNISYDTATRTIILEMADNTVLTAQLPLATAALAGLMSAAQCSSLATLITQMADVMDWLNQSVKTTASPTFANLTVGSVSINGSTGVASGLRFT